MALKTKGEIKAGLIAMGIDINIAELFIAYHAKRPEIWQQFERMALWLIKNRHENFGAKEIFEALRRGNEDIASSEKEFKLNNNFTSIYARVFVLFHPEYRHRIELRQARGALRMAA